MTGKLSVVPCASRDIGRVFGRTFVKSPLGGQIRMVPGFEELIENEATLVRRELWAGLAVARLVPEGQPQSLPTAQLFWWLAQKVRFGRYRQRRGR